MKLPTFQDFKTSERTVYAYLIMCAVASLFFMLKSNYDTQIKECNSERYELNKKIDTLNKTLIKVITKQNEILK
jgi:hypothetical protein